MIAIEQDVRAGLIEPANPWEVRREPLPPVTSQEQLKSYWETLSEAERNTAYERALADDRANRRLGDEAWHVKSKAMHGWKPWATVQSEPPVVDLPGVGSKRHDRVVLGTGKGEQADVLINDGVHEAMPRHRRSGSGVDGASASPTLSPKGMPSPLIERIREDRKKQARAEERARRRAHGQARGATRSSQQSTSASESASEREGVDGSQSDGDGDGEGGSAVNRSVLSDGSAALRFSPSLHSDAIDFDPDHADAGIDPNTLAHPASATAAPVTPVRMNWLGLFRLLRISSADNTVVLFCDYQFPQPLFRSSPPSLQHHVFIRWGRSRWDCSRSSERRARSIR
jgi:hypothetical protein